MKIRIGFEFLILLKFLNCIQIIIFDDWEYSDNICSTAIADAKAAGVCTQKSIEVIRRDGCSTENSMKCASLAINTISTRNDDDDDRHDLVFIGPQCLMDLQTIADFSMIWKTPVISYSSNVQSFHLIETTSMINVALFSAAGLIESLSILLNELELDHNNFTLIGSIERSAKEYSMLNTIKEYNTKSKKFEFSKIIEIDEENDSFSMIQDEIKKSFRTLVICTDFVDVYNVFYSLGLRQLSSYRFIIILLLDSSPDEVFYQSNIRNLIYGSNAFMIGPDSPKYSENLVKMKNMISTLESDKYSEFLWFYNSCYSYCFGSTIGAESYVSNYQNIMKEKSITNSFGTFTFDQRATLLTNYAVFSITPDDLKFEIIMSLSANSKPCDDFKCFELTSQTFDDDLWASKKLAEPDECVAKNECTNYLPHLIVGIVVALAIIIIVILIVLHRLRKINVYRLTWKVPKENLKIIVNKNADQKMQRELENRRANADGKTSQEGISSRRRIFGSYALVGTQRAEFIFFRQLKKIRWSEEQLKYLYNLKQLQNDNLTKFIGINFNDSENFYILHSLIDRLTLEECCIDLDFNMDATFKSAFMRDILKGLQYLHKSQIGYHGFLCSASCLIDNNWVLKLTNYGVSNMISQFHDDGTLKIAEHAPPQISHTQFAWFAPEHLKKYDPSGKSPPRFVEGSQQGDIYGVGLIFYEMIFRLDPFSPNASYLDRPSLTLISDIINNNLMPSIKRNGSEDLLIDMIVTCWDRNPSKRPGIKKLMDCISATYPASKGNLVDQMIKMSENYAATLNKIVEDRTAMLAEAEAQTMRLLNEMLPASIAKDLKDGKHIPPTSYDSATVMFVQICDFPILMNQSTPDQIIFFLNDVFDNFDTIIKNHDAYKVETTGETYMVASGVPNRNDGRHIFEIAEISLEIRDVSYKYSVKQNKNFKLRVKIGFHAGPIAAGVIGIRSPRYCLFGDTVNFASRMQSNCPPNQIQTSEQTANLLFETHEYKLVKRGIVHVKGKGEVNCYWLNEHIHEEMVEITNIGRPLTKTGNPVAMPKTDRLI